MKQDGGTHESMQIDLDLCEMVDCPPDVPASEDIMRHAVLIDGRWLVPRSVLV